MTGKFVFEVFERFEAKADDWDKGYVAGAEGCIHGEKGVLRISREMYERLNQSAKESLVRMDSYCGPPTVFGPLDATEPDRTVARPIERFHHSDPPSDRSQDLWKIWWREFCDNDQSEPPAMCTAGLAQKFSDWILESHIQGRLIR